MIKKVLYVVGALAILALLTLLPARVFVVQTGSMSPLYPSESAVLVDVNEFQLGQPIAFHQHNTVITHRWVGTNADGTLQTKGDANETIDPSSVNKADVIGGVIESVPKLGYWIMYFKNPFGIASLVCLGCAFWILWPLVCTPDDATERTSVQAT